MPLRLIEEEPLGPRLRLVEEESRISSRGVGRLLMGRPLSALKDIDPKKYKQEMAKYKQQMEAHPNIYAAKATPIGTAKELSKISFAKYLYAEEREKLMDLATQETPGGSNLATRQLLLDTLEAEGIIGWSKLAQGSKDIFKHYLPKTYNRLFVTPIGKKGVEKGGQTIAQKITEIKTTTGEMPKPEVIDDLMKQVASEPEIKPVLREVELPKPSEAPQVAPGAAKAVEAIPEKEVTAYHGTWAYDEFDKFDTTRGTFFSESPKMAKTYTELRETQTEKIGGIKEWNKRKNQRVIKAKLDIKNPLDLTRFDIDEGTIFQYDPSKPFSLQKSIQNELLDILGTSKDKLQKTLKKEFGNKWWYDENSHPGELALRYIFNYYEGPRHTNVPTLLAATSNAENINPSVMKLLKGLGYDGIILRDQGTWLPGETKKIDRAYAVFDSDQITITKPAEVPQVAPGAVEPPPKPKPAEVKPPPIDEEPLPKYAQSVNLEKQAISDEAKRLELQMAGKKKTQSWDKTDELSEAILNDMKKTEEALQKVSGLTGLTENIEAVRKVNINQVNNLARMAEDVKSGAMTEEAFNTAFNDIKKNFFKITSEGSSEIGRALNVHKKMLTETDHMIKGLSKIEKGLRPDQINAFVEAVKSNNPAKMAKFTAELENPRIKDYILEYWYNSILSGLPTHAVNMISNTIWNTYQIPHRAHVALWDKIYSGLTGKSRTRLINELIPMMAGYKKGFGRGAKGALETIKTGQLQEFETKWAQEMGLSSISAWERSPNKFMRDVAPIVSAPTRVLRAADVWVNAMAYDAEMLSIANRTGILKGLKGDALKTFVTNFVKNPTEEVSAQAMKYAKHSTFMDDPDPFTAWILGVRKVPVIGPASQFVVPFVNTIANLTKRGLELIPVIGIGKEVISRGMGRGQTIPEVIAKQIEGSILGLYILYKCDKGEITGAAPRSEAERERFYAQGKQPWGIRLGGKTNPETGKIEGGTWISYRRMEPFNTPIASVSIAHENIKNAKDDETRTQIFANMANDLKNNLIDSSYFQGLQQVFNHYQKLEKAPQRTAASFIPYSSFWRSMNRAYEKATQGEVTVKEGDTWVSAFAQVIPGLSGKAPAKLNIWGEETVIPGSVLQHWLPYKWSKETQDPVEIELERVQKAVKDSPKNLNVYPEQPGQIITYREKKIKLSNDDYRSYLIDTGRELRTEYEKMMYSTSYLSRTDELKALMLNKITDRVRAKMRAKLIQKIKKETK